MEIEASSARDLGGKMMADAPLPFTGLASLWDQHEERQAPGFKPSLWEKAMASMVTLAPGLVGANGSEWTEATHKKCGCDVKLLQQVYEKYREFKGGRQLSGKSKFLSSAQKLDLIRVWEQHYYSIELWCREAYPELPSDFRMPPRITEWGKKTGRRNGLESSLALGLRGFVKVRKEDDTEAEESAALEQPSIEMKLLVEETVRVNHRKRARKAEAEVAAAAFESDESTSNVSLDE